MDQKPSVSGTPPAGIVNQSYSHTFTIAGQPTPVVTVTDGDLPTGLTLSKTGVLSGTPTTTGTYPFTITATNGVGADSVLTVTFVVDSAPITPGLPPTGSFGS